MNVFNIQRAFEDKKRRGWTQLYWAIDLHDTIIPGSYTKNNEGKDFFPGAKEVLQWLTKREDMVLILWTSSHEEPVRKILKWLYKHDIRFQCVNKNPFCPNTALCDFSKKLYMNIILDDKSSLVGEHDWFLIARQLEVITGEKILKWTPSNKRLLKEAVSKTKLSLDELVAFTNVIRRPKWL